MRSTNISRTTKETDISLKLNIDGKGDYEISTGIGFLDHMLILLAKHSFMDLGLTCKGDLYVDGHHTVEDIGIVLGTAINKALGDKVGIQRYGHAYIPMDEALAFVALDFSGRGYLVLDGPLDKARRVGDFEVELLEEFLRALAINAGMTLHVKVMYGSNHHHMIEAIFKALAKALKEGWKKDDRIIGVMSTKGTL